MVALQMVLISPNEDGRLGEENRLFGIRNEIILKGCLRRINNL